ncbi:hypothetical protein B0G83_103227 [Paraburkholderia sp. BL21I4N1]|nr:hypothetical protein B0G83_103227 [Paraburkholderia sp. BL21I4N1]
MTQSLDRKPLGLPNAHRKVLPPSCCAPCVGEVMEAASASISASALSDVDPASSSS